MILTIQHKTSNLEKTKKLVQILSAYSGLNIYNPSFLTIMGAINKQTEYELDFDDGLVLSCMASLKISNLVSFDSHFENISAINLLSPRLALEFFRKRNKVCLEKAKY